MELEDKIRKEWAVLAGINTSLDSIKSKIMIMNLRNCYHTCEEPYSRSYYSTNSCHWSREDNFKLSSVGVGTTSNDFYYKTKQYRDSLLVLV